MRVNSNTFLPSHRHIYTVLSMDYGQRLRASREYAGLTQAELAERCGVSQPTISGLEKSSALGSAYTVRFADACGVNPRWLADGVGSMTTAVFMPADRRLIESFRAMQDLPDYLIDAAAQYIADAHRLAHAAPPTSRPDAGKEGRTT